jgi:hypothetical protein
MLYLISVVDKRYALKCSYSAGVVERLSDHDGRGELVA